MLVLVPVQTVPARRGTVGRQACARKVWLITAALQIIGRRRDRTQLTLPLCDQSTGTAGHTFRSGLHVMASKLEQEMDTNRQCLHKLLLAPSRKTSGSWQQVVRRKARCRNSPGFDGCFV